MPVVNVEVIENVFSTEQKQRIIRDITEVMIAIEGEALRPYTLVKIDEVKEGNWAFGGQSLRAGDVKALQKAGAQKAA